VSVCVAVDDTDLRQIAPSVVKECHWALATCVLEAVKHNADKAAISTFLEDSCKFHKERTEEFWTEYQKYKEPLEILLGNIGRCPPHVSDVSWRLAYEIKTNQLHKTYRPSYYVNFSMENSDPTQAKDVSFTCSMEQLQDLVGKLKDAAKSLERTSQM
ncbi:TPA: hypothetical protein GDO54_018552, partial [Pyxicephalus adspersus]